MKKELEYLRIFAAALIYMFTVCTILAFIAGGAGLILTNFNLWQSIGLLLLLTYVVMRFGEQFTSFMMRMAASVYKGHLIKA